MLTVVTTTSVVIGQAEIQITALDLIRGAESPTEGISVRISDICTAQELSIVGLSEKLVDYDLGDPQIKYNF